MSNKPISASELTQKRSDSNVAYYFNTLEIADPAGRILSRRTSGTTSSDVINLQLARTTFNQTLSSFQSIYNIQPLPGLYRKNFRISENSNARTTYTSPAAATYTVPTTTNGLPVVGVNMYIWGGGGGFGNQPNGLGGGGGFVSGFYKCPGGTVLTYVLGRIDGTRTLLAGGGSTTGGGNVNGAGFSAIFNCTSTAAAAQNNVIALAGGGGSSGQYAYGIGGGGGYPAGLTSGASIEGQGGTATGGTQTAGGTGNGGTGEAMLGTFGGGGGYFGGGATFRGAGGGGSSYIGGLTSDAYWENGITGSNTSVIAYPGGITNKYYTGTYGRATNTSFTSGLIVIVPCYEEWDGTYS
jgi:hypothetical protein